MPSLRSTAMRDFFDILHEHDLYEKSRHNKTENTYRLGESLVEFVSLDEPQKKRGAKRDYLWLNEANEFTLEDWRQLSFRTSQQAYLDFNPSDQFHWIYDHIMTRKDYCLIKSTYLDNPFLGINIIKEIEHLKETDPAYWKVYGEGERGMALTTIYTHWQHARELPAGGETMYGLDFGYNNPTALVKVVIKDGAVYARELLYASFLTNADCIASLKKLIPDRRATIYADAAEPQRIEEIYRAGFNIKAADKDVSKGIDTLKSKLLYISTDSINLLKEISSYKFKEDMHGKVLDEPQKFNDHAVDALRYAVHSYFLQPTGKYAVR